jgi:hypothetical protein
MHVQKDILIRNQTIYLLNRKTLLTLIAYTHLLYLELAWKILNKGLHSPHEFLVTCQKTIDGIHGIIETTEDYLRRLVTYNLQRTLVTEYVIEDILFSETSPTHFSSGS